MLCSFNYGDIVENARKALGGSALVHFSDGCVYADTIKQTSGGYQVQRYVLKVVRSIHPPDCGHLYERESFDVVWSEV